MTSPTPRKLAEYATEYAAHGWPVAPIAVPTDGSCPCGDTCQAMHLLQEHIDGITREAEARKVWTDHSWQIGIVTVLFDVVDLPGTHGSPIHDRLKPAVQRRPHGPAGGWTGWSSRARSAGSCM